MAEQAKVPAIRFAGFTDPWEQRKFGELYRPVSEKNDVSFGRDKAISVANMYFNPAVYVTEDSYLATYNVMRLGDIAFEGNRSKRFAHGRFVENTIGDGIVSHVFKVFRHVGDNYDLSYWKHAINNEKLMKDVLTRSTKASTMMHELVTADFLEELTLVPSLNEQRAIGAAIDSIDNLITLHQRKYDKLVVFKKSMLEKMFPKDGESVPEIRFAGFTDPWEQRKLEDIANRVTRKNEGESDLPLTISSQYGLVDQRTFFNNQVASKDMSGYYLLRKGEFAYNKSTSGDSPWGAVKRLVRYEKGCVSTLYICFGLDGADPDFLVTYYETDRWYKAVQMIAAEGARNHGLLNIAPNDFFDTALILPPSREEQELIGLFFARLDNLITLHQRKLELLQNIKKSLLDKMFV